MCAFDCVSIIKFHEIISSGLSSQFFLKYLSQTLNREQTVSSFKVSVSQNPSSPLQYNADAKWSNWFSLIPSMPNYSDTDAMLISSSMSVSLDEIKAFNEHVMPSLAALID